MIKDNNHNNYKDYNKDNGKTMNIHETCKGSAP